MQPIPAVLMLASLFAATPVDRTGSIRAVADDLDLTRFTGIARPQDWVVLAAPEDGLLYRVLVDEGDKVQADQPLAEMKQDRQELQVQIAQARALSDAEVRAAKAALDEAQILLDRGEDLLTREAAHDWEVRRTRVQRDRARADYDLAVQQQVENRNILQLERVRLDELTPRAPFPGTIVRVMLEPGAFVERGTELLALANLDTLEAEIHLPVELYGQLCVGDRHTLRAAAPVDRALDAELAYIEPIIDAPSQTFRCVFEIDNDDHALPAGFTFQIPTLVRSAAKP